MARDLSDYSISSLAWVGDAVFELHIRTRLAGRNRSGSGALHREATRFVSARGQARLMEGLLEASYPLEADELNLLRRARNFHASSLPKNTPLPDYRKATALEALIGWLWLSGQTSRAAELMDFVLADWEDAGEDGPAGE